jgi:hypothetical protein
VSVAVIIGLAQCSLAETRGKTRYSDSTFAGKYRNPRANPRRRTIMAKFGFGAEFDERRKPNCKQET